MKNREVVNEIGKINIDRVEATNGTLTTYIPVEAFSSDMDNLMERLEADFSEKHPDVENVNSSIRVVYSFGGYINSEFELEVIFWDSTDENVAEFYEEIQVNLSESSKREVKAIIWQALGKMLLNI